jgi:hypothetical protein
MTKTMGNKQKPFTLRHNIHKQQVNKEEVQRITGKIIY